MPTSPKICVVGSSNIDLLTKISRLPKIGETLFGQSFHMGFGGKGANQAVMAARLGANVTMVSKLGNDYFGEITLQNYKQQKINTEFIFFDSNSHSGVAPIFVDESGNNIIVVVSGANDRLSESDVILAERAIKTSSVLICQLEIPLQSTMKAADRKSVV